MSNITVNLLVLKVINIEETSVFYSALGLSFNIEQHGQGPKHYSSLLGSTLLEIYPANHESITTNIRLGLNVKSIQETLNKITTVGGSVISQAKSTPWGLRAVISNSDGHMIELIENS